MSDSTDSSPPAAALSDQEVVEMVAGIRGRLFAEVGKVIVGQQEVVDQMLMFGAYLKTVKSICLKTLT